MNGEFDSFAAQLGGVAAKLDSQAPARTIGACPYELCDGSGFTIDEASNTATDCRCRPARVAKIRAQSLAGRVPTRYRGVSFDRPPVSDIARVAPEQVREVKRYVRDIEQNLDNGRGLWLVGDVGTGKTTLAMIASKAALDAGRSVVIHSLPRLLNMIRGAIETDAGMLGFLDRLTAVDLLHIDDVGAENTTDWVLEQLYSIINTRYEDERALIITTNLMPDKLIEQIGERTVSRLVEICGDPLHLFGEDKRRQYEARTDAHAETRTDAHTGTPTEAHTNAHLEARTA